MAGVTLTIHPQIMLRSRKCGSMHPLPHMPSWHSDEFVKHRGQHKKGKIIPELA
jgi:hypothetical protein